MDTDLALTLQKTPLLALALAFVGGVATSFTPCVYPILPITVSYIGARGADSRLHAFLLSAFYALGMSATYAALGMVAALTGRIFGAMTQSPYVFLAVGNVILFSGLTMLDLIPLSLPSFLTGSGKASRGKGLPGAFLLGVTSGLVVGPCTAPVLATILTYVSARKQVALGAATLFLFALGMSTLIVVAGTFSGFLSLLPRSGGWMVRVKKGFGWLMIGLGEYFLLRAGMAW